MKVTPVIAGVVLLLVGGLPTAQGAEPKTKSKNISISIGDSEAKNEAGIIEEGADIEGITIINGEVSIDGVKVPRGVKKYRSPKTGKTYRIDWGKGDNVSVSEP